MTFQRKIKEVDVLRALLGVWEKTCVHPAKIGLVPFIREDTPSVRGIAANLGKVMVDSGVLIRREGHVYEWNRKAGPPTYVMARELLAKARRLNAERVAAHYQRKKLKS